MDLLRRIDSCKHLQLIPQKDEVQRVRTFLWYFQDPQELEEMTREDRLEYTQGLASVQYELRCSLDNDPCVATESPVISMAYGGDLTQPL